MPREVETQYQWTEDPRFGLRKQRTVIRTTDGHVYEFEEKEGDPAPRLVRGFKPDGTITHTTGSKVLPSAVEETAKSLLGEFRKS